MARRVRKQCPACQQLFLGRRDAIACSERCRKRLQRARSTLVSETRQAEVKLADAIKEVEQLIVPKMATEAGFIEVAEPPAAAPQVPSSINPPVGADVLPNSANIAPAPLVSPVLAETKNTPAFESWLDSHSAQQAEAAQSYQRPNQSYMDNFTITLPRFLRWALVLMVLVPAVVLGAYGGYSAIVKHPSNNSGQASLSSQFTGLNSASGTLHINYDTQLSNGKQLTATGPVVIQNDSDSTGVFKIQSASGNDLLVADAVNKEIKIGSKPPGQVALNVSGDITTNGSLVSTTHGYSLGNNGLTIGGKVVCTANGCVSSSSPPPTPASPTIDVANLAYLDTNQTFSGINTFTGNNSFAGRNSFNNTSTTAFQVQNAAGTDKLFVVDTSNNRIGIGTTPAASGATVQIAGDINVSSGVYKIGNVSGGSFACSAGEVLQQATITGGIVTSGSCVTIAGGTTPTLQQVYDASTPADIRLGSISGMIQIQDSASPLATDLFEVTDSSGTTKYFAVNNLGISVTGNINTTGQYQINGTQISSANLGDGANLAKLNGNQTFTGANSFTSASNSFSGSGAGLTSLSATNVSSGTLSNARLSAQVTLQGNTFNGANQLVQLTAGGILPVLSGANLTNLNASSVASGTLSDARLSANVALLNANQSFTGNDTFKLSSAALSVQDAFTPLGADLFTVTDNSGATKYFEVSASGVKINGNDVCTSAGNCVGTGGGGAIGGSGTAGTIPVFTGSGFTIGNSNLSQSGTTTNAAGNFNLASGSKYQINGSQISSSDLSDGANLAKLGANQTFTGANSFSSASNSFTGNGSGLTSLNASNVSSGTLSDARLSANVALLNANQTFSGNNTFALSTAGLAVQDAASPLGTNLFSITNHTGATTYFSVSATALQFLGHDVCTTAGNCAGAGNGGGITGSGSQNYLTKFDSSGNLVDSIISDNGTTATVAGSLAVNTITPTATLTVGTATQTLSLQGDASTSLSAASGSFTNKLVFAAPALSNKTVTIPNASGTVAVSASGPLSLDAAGNITCPNCLTTNGSGGGAGVSSVNTLSGNITLAGTANEVIITPSSNTLTFSTPQAISTSSSPQFTNINVTGQYQVNGSQIASTNLNDSNNLARLNASQTFTGSNLFQNTGATAFEVQNAAAADTMLTVDTSARGASGGNLVKIGNNTGTDTNTTILVVDSTTAAPTTDLSALNGGIFYNSTDGHVSVIENGVVKELCNQVDLSCGGNSTTLQQAYDNSSSPASIVTSSAAKNLIVQSGSGNNSSSVFQIQDSSGSSNLFIADTIHNRIAIDQATATYTLDVAGDINTTTGYRVGGTAGATVTCSSGNVVQNATITGGIITGGTCVGNGAGTAPTLAQVYNNGTSSAASVLGLNSTASGVLIRDNATPIGGTLFGVQDSTGTNKYLGVTSSGISVGGNVNITGMYEVNGTQISTSNLSNGSDIALLDANQTFTGNNTLTGTTLVKNTGTTAVQIQKADGSGTLFVADTQNTRIAIAQASASYTLDVGGDINTTTGYRVGGTAGGGITCSGGNVIQNAVVTGGIITGGSCVANGAGATTTLQNAYDNSTSPAKIVTSSATKNIIFQSGSGFNSTGLFQIQDASSNVLFNADTVNRYIGINTPNPNATLDVQASSAGFTDGFESGALSPFTASSFSVTSAFAHTGTYSAGDSGGNGTLDITKTMTAGGNVSFWAQIHTSSTGTEKFVVDGGTVNTWGGGVNIPFTFYSFAISSGTHTFEWQNNGAGNSYIDDVTIPNASGGGNSALFNGGSVGIGTFFPGATLETDGTALFKSTTNSTTAFQIQNAAGAQVLTVDTTTNSATINQGNLTVTNLASPNIPTLTSSGSGGTLAAATYYYEVAATNANGSTPAIASSPASVTTSGSTSQNTLTWTAVTNANGYNIYRSTDGSSWFKNSVSSSITSITDNGTNFTWSTSATPPSANTTGGNITANGSALFKDVTNSTSAFQVQDSSGNSALNIDTTNRFIGINQSTPSATLDVQASSSSFFDTFETGAISPFTSTGGWTITTTNRHDGSYAVNIVGLGGGNPNLGQLQITKTLSAPGTLSYWAYGVCGYGLKVDGSVVGSGQLTANNTWLLESFSVASGTHTFSIIQTAGTCAVTTPNLTIDDVTITNAGTGTTALFNGGNVGIGTSFPNATLSVSASSLGDTTSLFQVQNAAGTSMLNADSTNMQVTVGQSSLFVTDLSAPTSPSVVAGANTGGTLSGAAATTYYYKITALSGTGESLASSEVSINGQSFTKLSAPVAATGSAAAGSNLGIGNYLYKLTVVTANGETTAGTESATITTTSGNQSVNLTLPAVPTGATGYHVYRTAVGGASGSELLLTAGGCSGTISATSCTDSATDAQRSGSAPASNTATTNTNNATVSWTAVTGATSYRIYRGTSSGGESAYQTSTTSPFTDTGAAGTAGTVHTYSSIDAVGIGTTTPGANLDVEGSVLFKNAQNSTTAFQIQTASASDTLFTADTANNKIVIGNSTGTNTATTLLTLDNATADPTTGYNGAMYFNSSTNKFRCYSNSAWADCNAVATTLQNAYDNSSSPATITTSSASKTILLKAGVGSDATNLFNIQDSGSNSILDADSTHRFVGINNASPNATLDVLASSTSFIDGFETGTLSPFTTSSTNGAAVWTTTSSGVHAGSFAASGTDTLNVATTTLSLTKTLNSAGTISFYGAYSNPQTASSWDFQVDGVTKTSSNTATGYTLYSFSVASGTHTFTWDVNTSGVSGNTLKVDDVTVTNAGVGTTALFNGGNVGIGTSFPNYSLDVSGTAHIQASSNNSTEFSVQNVAGNNYLLVDTSGASLYVGNTGIASTIQIGNTTGAVAQTLNIGNNATASSSTTLNIGSTIGGSTTNVTAGSGGINLNASTSVASNVSFTANGAATFKDATNSTSAFRVQDSSSNTILNVDSTNRYIGINTATPNASLDVNGASANFFDGFETGTLSPFTSSSWTVQTPGHTGSYLAQNTSNSTSSIQVTQTLSSSGTISFWWYCAAGDANDHFYFQIDSNPQVQLETSNCSVGGVAQSGTYSTAVTPGTHTFTWTGSTDGFFTNVFKLDDVKITNAGTATTATFNGGLVGIGTFYPNATLEADGTALFKSTSNSATAFQVQNSNGNKYILVDTSGANLYLGNTGIASTIQIGNTTGAVAQTINIGNNATASSTTSIVIGSTVGASTVTIQSGTGNITLNSPSIMVNGHVVTGNSSGSTTATVNGNAGTSATCSVSGNDAGGQITLVTGTASWAAGTQCTINFANSYGAAPHPVISSANSTDTSLVKPYVGSAAGSFTINFIAPDTASNTYVFNYFIAQ